MRTSAGRVLVVAAACLVWLTGCETSTKLTGLFSTQRSDPDSPPRSRIRPTPPIPRPPDRSPRPPIGRRSHRSPTPDPIVNAANAAAARQGSLRRPQSRQEVFPLGQFRPGRKAFPPRGRAASARCRSLGRARGVLRPAEAFRPRRPRLWAGRRHHRRDAGDHEQQGLLLHAARRLCARAPHAEAAQARAPDNPYIRNNLELLEKVQRRGKAIN